MSDLPNANQPGNQPNELSVINSSSSGINNPAMNQQATASQKSRAEQETENEANRLREQVDSALLAVASRSPEEIESLQSAADRIERAARDLADALRQLAQQRRT